MWNLAFSIFLVLILSACGPAPTSAGVETEPPTDGAFIHISHGSGDPHRALMALSMANKMAEEGRDVLVYVDITGVELVLEDSEDITMEPFESSHTLLGRLREKGVTVMACPRCLQAAGKSETDLIEGVVLAKAATFFTFTQGRILTLDY